MAVVLVTGGSSGIVLISNAGVGGPGALEEVPARLAHEILEVNLFGPMRRAAAAAPVMRAAGGGRAWRPEGAAANASNRNVVVGAA